MNYASQCANAGKIAEHLVRDTGKLLRNGAHNGTFYCMRDGSIAYENETGDVFDDRDLEDQEPEFQAAWREFEEKSA